MAARVIPLELRRAMRRSGAKRLTFARLTDALCSWWTARVLLVLAIASVVYATWNDTELERRPAGDERFGGPARGAEVYP